MILAIDPGTTQSGIVVLYDGRISQSLVLNNVDVLPWCKGSSEKGNEVVIEMIASYGMPAGRELFETCVWIGRFIESTSNRAHRLYRRDVKHYFCQSPHAKDPHIWQAIVDRYGGKQAAIGNKKNPGPLYGVKSHARAALALGLAWQDGVRSEGLT